VPVVSGLVAYSVASGKGFPSWLNF